MTINSLFICISACPLCLAEEQGEDELLAAADDGEDPVPYNKLMMPEVVVSLDAGDEFLKQRVMNLPQRQVEGTHNTEDGRTQTNRWYTMHNNLVLCRFEEEAGAVQEW